MVLLISYDLNGHERPSAYTKVKAAIEAGANSHRRILYSQWLVETDAGVDTWTKRLTRLIDSDDRLLVIKVEGRVNGWLEAGDLQWINARVPGASIPA